MSHACVCRAQLKAGESIVLGRHSPFLRDAFGDQPQATNCCSEKQVTASLIREYLSAAISRAGYFYFFFLIAEIGSARRAQKKAWVEFYGSGFDSSGVAQPSPGQSGERISIAINNR